MPDTDPDNATDPMGGTIRPHDDDSAAKQVADTGQGATPGGGGLGGGNAADALGGSARAPEGASPNSPIDTGTPPPDGERSTETREAQLRSLADGAPESERQSR